MIDFHLHSTEGATESNMSFRDWWIDVSASLNTKLILSVNKMSSTITLPSQPHTWRIERRATTVIDFQLHKPSCEIRAKLVLICRFE